MKLISFPLFTCVIILLISGCECRYNYYGEPALTFVSNIDNTVEVYHINNNNNLYLGKLDSLNPKIDYALNIHDTSMKFLLRYDSGIDDILIIKYTAEIQYSKKCDYFIDVFGVSHTFTKNNLSIARSISVTENELRHEEKIGFTAFINRY